MMMMAMMMAMTSIDASELGSCSSINTLLVVRPSLPSAAVSMPRVVLALAMGVAVVTMPSAAVSMPLVVLALAMGVVVVTTTGVATTGADIVGAAIITDSPLQSASAIAKSVWALITAEAPAILVARALAMLMLATFTLKLVFTETLSESWRAAVESRRAPRVKPVMVRSKAGTDRAATKPAFLAA
jgi:hypothetical protein